MNSEQDEVKKLWENFEVDYSIDDASSFGKLLKRVASCSDKEEVDKIFERDNYGMSMDEIYTED